MKDGLCRHGRHQRYLLQGTVVQDSDIPQITWLRAIWHICSPKNGASALGWQRTPGLGSYRMGWLMLHKLRCAVVCPRRDDLRGVIAVDETYAGRIHDGKRGRGADGKSIVMDPAECDGKGTGRIRLPRINGVQAQTLTSAVLGLVFSGLRILTGERGLYNDLFKNGYIHEIHKASGEIPPRCHRAISLLKRWIQGPLQGSIAPEHLQDCLNEFTFRCTRRKSKSRGLLFHRLLQYAVETAPVTYDEITISRPVGWVVSSAYPGKYFSTIGGSHEKNARRTIHRHLQTLENAAF